MTGRYAQVEVGAGPPRIEFPRRYNAAVSGGLIIGLVLALGVVSRLGVYNGNANTCR